MMKKYNYILSLILLSLLAGCTNDDIDDTSNDDISFCVRAAWQNGLAPSGSTRAMTDDILAEGSNDIAISTGIYPATIYVYLTGSDEKDFTLTKGDVITSCTKHQGFWAYTPSIIYRDTEIKRNNLTFTATAEIQYIANKDNYKETVKAEFGYENIKDKHMQVTLKHTKALIRFAFKVSDKYDKVRFIQVKSIKLNGNDCVLVDKVLSTSDQFIAYALINPIEVINKTEENKLVCTYNIYDKDAKFDGTMTPENLASHLTREGAKASNTFNFKFKDTQNNLVTEIKAGYYYDLNVTLNPDYLYVLSDHDEQQHLIIQ